MKRRIIKILKSVLYITILLVLFNGCTLLAPMVKTTDDSIYNYRYFYITPTGTYTSSSGVYGNSYGIYGGNIKSTNPTAIISGILMKHGFIQVNEVNPQNANKTMIINFAESERRPMLFGYTIEVTIQFITAINQKPICTCTAEGMGETEVDDVRMAIQRALAPILEKKNDIN